MLIERRTARGTAAERRATGRATRLRTTRGALGGWTAPLDRHDPVALIEASNVGRVPELVPVRHGRMAVSAFTFYRGSAGLMAADLASAPSTGLRVHLCGDCHLSNFGLFATPERNLIFDINDFDETAPGPFEWDLKRLAASLVLAARDNGRTSRDALRAATETARQYREQITALAAAGPLEAWYGRVEPDIWPENLRRRGREGDAARIEAFLAKTRRRTSEGALPKLTQVVDGRRRIVWDEPYIAAPEDEVRTIVSTALASYRRTLRECDRRLLDRFDVIDFARKVVGVGSVGLRAWILLLEADGESLFLQLKEATRSVLEPHTGRVPLKNHGQRVVTGQRTMQAASDLFLGWLRYQPLEQDYYVRQLRDMKGSIPVETLGKGGLRLYGALCGDTLARAHARGGDPVAIAGYVGGSSAFDDAIASFAMAYADQAERDYAAFMAAIESGRLEHVPDLRPR